MKFYPLEWEQEEEDEGQRERPGDADRQTDRWTDRKMALGGPAGAVDIEGLAQVEPEVSKTDVQGRGS